MKTSVHQKISIYEPGAFYSTIKIDKIQYRWKKCHKPLLHFISKHYLKIYKNPSKLFHGIIWERSWYNLHLIFMSVCLRIKVIFIKRTHCFQKRDLSMTENSTANIKLKEQKIWETKIALTTCFGFEVVLGFFVCLFCFFLLHDLFPSCGSLVAWNLNIRFINQALENRSGDWTLWMI